MPIPPPSVAGPALYRHCADCRGRSRCARLPPLHCGALHLLRSARACLALASPCPAHMPVAAHAGGDGARCCRVQYCAWAAARGLSALRPPTRRVTRRPKVVQVHCGGHIGPRNYEQRQVARAPREDHVRRPRVQAHGEGEEGDHCELGRFPHCREQQGAPRPCAPASTHHTRRLCRSHQRLPQVIASLSDSMSADKVKELEKEAQDHMAKAISSVKLSDIPDTMPFKEVLRMQ